MRERHMDLAENPDRHSLPRVASDYRDVLSAGLIDQIAVPERIRDLFLAALVLTACAVFAGANILLFNFDVVAASAPVGLTCIGIVGLFCALVRVLTSAAWALALCYGALLLTVYGPHEWTTPAFSILLVLGCAYTLLGVLRSHFSKTELVSLVRMSLIGAATILGTVGAYTSFDMVDRLHAGDVHQDTLFHASIAAMIKNYGVVSTGLHGLVETPYHALSHALYATISLISGAPVIEVYGVASWMLFAPILVFSLGYCALALDSKIQLHPAAVWHWTCVLLAVTPLLLNKWVVWDSYFVSESYLAALSPFVLGLPLFYKKGLTRADLVLLVLLTGLASGAKASVGLIFVGLFCLRLLLLKPGWPLPEAITAAAMIVAAAAVLFRAAAGQEHVSFGLLDFVAQYSVLGKHLRGLLAAVGHGMAAAAGESLLAAAALGSFLIMHFLHAWTVVAYTARKKGMRQVLSSPSAVFCLGATGFGLAIVFVFRIAGGGVYYFSNVAMFVALPALVAIALRWFTVRRFAATSSLVAMLTIVVLLSVTSYHNISALSWPHDAKAHSGLVDDLLLARTSLPQFVILDADASTLARSPVTRCSARPFLFPALSERAWLGVIDRSLHCEYAYYGYSDYRLTPDTHQPSIEPRLVAGTQVRQWLTSRP